MIFFLALTIHVCGYLGYIELFWGWLFGNILNCDSKIVIRPPELNSLDKGRKCLYEDIERQRWLLFAF